MLLSFSMYAFSLQNNTLNYTDAKNISAEHNMNTVSNINKAYDHCNDTTTFQQCNSCVHCAILSMQPCITILKLLTEVCGTTILYSERTIELPYKPPRV